MFLAILYLILVVIFAIFYPDYTLPRSRYGGIVAVLLFVIIGIKLFYAELSR